MKPNTSLNKMNHSKRNSRSCLVERRPWLRSVGGFTLTELMVVIALVSLLTGLLFPGLRLVREKANQIKCKSNLQSLGLAVQMYADQHDGRCPIVTDLKQVPQKFKEALQPYVKSEEIFWCPADREKEARPGGSYDWRVTHDPKTSLSGVRLDLIRHPNRVIIAGDRSAGWHKSGMINVLYADGHVDQVTEKEWWDNITTPIESL